MKRALLGAAAAALLVPEAAHAHGLVQRANLPIPEWLFGWAAAVVLVVSFAALGLLWSRPRLEDDKWRPLPGGIGKLIASRPVEIVTGALGVALLAVVIVAGFAGPPDPLSNFAPDLPADHRLGRDGVRQRALRRRLPRRSTRGGRSAASCASGSATRYPERSGVWPAAAAC